jgi:hypothetical protein
MLSGSQWILESLKNNQEKEQGQSSYMKYLSMLLSTEIIKHPNIKTLVSQIEQSHVN